MTITPAAAAWIAAVVWLAAAPAAAQTASVQRPGVLLDVPYVPQSELLCGGAAAAMVMRYWGARDVSAASFAPLVDRAAHGIATTSLVDDLRRRSWSVVAASGTDADVKRELTRGHPVIALVAAGRGRFHYVVIVAWTRDRIVLHDPARAPFRTIDAKRFDAEWRASNRWMLILLPSAALERALHSEGREVPAGPPEPADDPRDACAPDVSRAIRAAQAGDATSATETLERAAAACPHSAAVWRELAGADAAASRWHEAADHARRALAVDSRDEQAWRVLAAAEYVQRHDRAALDAWNHLGEPRLDLVNVQGLTRTRYAIAADAIGIDPGMPITADALTLAERRLRDVPSLSSATVGYHPVENERAQVDAAVVERDVAPLNYPAWIGMGVEAAAKREVTASFASPTGGGELASVAWRWWTGRPMIAASFAAPAPAALGGTWRVDVSRETQSFGPSVVQQTRVHAGLAAGKWISTTLKLDGGVSLEHWIDGPHMAALSARAEIHRDADRLIVDGGGSAFAGNAAPFATADARLAWRSRIQPVGLVWTADAGAAVASESAPASLWPGAGTGHARDVLLRAHPLLSGGAITGSVFGRTLTFAHAEAQTWRRPRRWPIRVAPAAFVDAARADDGLVWTSRRAQLDAGAGLRIALPGSGVMRIDWARGLRDGTEAFSIGYAINR